jgi:tripartite-type tricarboxylate transporter receptor subunit TctC
MEMLGLFRLSILGAVTACALLASPAARAQSSLTLVIGYPPGAIYDVYGRLVARHLGKNLPGKPNVVVQNMAGAGSLRSATYIYNVAPKDGSTIGLFARGLPMQPLLDETGIQFDAQKFSYIGSASAEVSVLVARGGSDFKTIEDAQKKEMVLSASGSGADSVIFPYILNGVIDTKFKVVTGYPGNAEMLLAVERGEADGNSGTSWVTLVSIKPDWIKEKKVNILLQMASKKHADLPDVPLATDLAKDDSARKVMEFIFSRQDVAYPFVAPPGIPADRLQVLRKAFDDTMKDPEYRAEAQKMSMEVDPVSGAELEAVIRKVYATPSDVVARVKSVLEAGKKVTSSK